MTGWTRGFDFPPRTILKVPSIVARHRKVPVNGLGKRHRRVMQVVVVSVGCMLSFVKVSPAGEWSCRKQPTVAPRRESRSRSNW
jgi:hypothetical protein